MIFKTTEGGCVFAIVAFLFLGEVKEKNTLTKVAISVGGKRNYKARNNKEKGIAAAKGKKENNKMHTPRERERKRKHKVLPKSQNGSNKAKFKTEHNWKTRTKEKYGSSKKLGTGVKEKVVGTKRKN